MSVAVQRGRPGTGQGAALLLQLADPGTPGTARSAPTGNPAEIVAHLRASRITLTYDPQGRTLRADTSETATVTIDRTR